MIEQDFNIVFCWGEGEGRVFVTPCAFKSFILIRTRHGNDHFLKLFVQDCSYLIPYFYMLSGVSIKIEVASSLYRVANCIKKGPLVPFSSGKGGRSKRVLPPKILKCQSPKNVIFSVLGTKLF